MYMFTNTPQSIAPPKIKSAPHQRDSSLMFSRTLRAEEKVSRRPAGDVGRQMRGYNDITICFNAGESFSFRAKCLKKHSNL